MKWSVSAREFKTIADTLKDVLTQCWFLFSPQGIQMFNVDPEKVALVRLDIQPDSTKYTCNESITFSTYMQTIYKVMRGSKNQDTATITIEDTSDPLAMYIEIFEGDGTKKNVICLSNMADKYPKFVIPTTSYKYSIRMNTTNLYHIFHDLSVVSREFIFDFSNCQLKMSAKDDCGTVKSHWIKFEGQPGNHKGKYLIKYAEKFCKPRLSKFVTIRFSPGMPLSLLFDVEDGFLEMSIAELE